MIEELGRARDATILDVGGGTSTLVDCLLDRGFTVGSVLDLSETALATSRRRVRDRIGAKWFRADVLEWQPHASIELWHDRAIFHFLVKPADWAMYDSVMRAALAPRGVVILLTIAADGPERCSGLPVRRYGPDDLTSLFGDGFEDVLARREEHRTPWGAIQPFTWVAMRSFAERRTRPAPSPGGKR